MPTYDRYPAVDENLELPPTVMQPNQAIAITTATRDALPAARTWDGRQIYNTTLRRYERWDSVNSIWRTIADQQDASTLLATTGTPAANGLTADRGASNFAARADHIHSVPQSVDYTPTYNYNIGGTGSSRAGRYQLHGKWCTFWAKISFGAGFTLGAPPSIGLPFPSRLNLNADVMCDANLLDSGSSNYRAVGVIYSNSAACNVWLVATNGGLNAITYTAPFTWATPDAITINGTYEIG